MRAAILLFVSVLGMLGVAGLMFTIPEKPTATTTVLDEATGTSTEVVAIEGHGVAHARFETMRHGGDGPARAEGIGKYALAFALFQVLFFASCLMLGSQRRGKPTPMTIPIAIGAIGYMAVFVGLFRSYEAYLATTTPELFLGIPYPTAWMLIGVWFFPVFFIGLYVATFDRWYLTPDDIDRFHELVAERHAKDDA